MEVVNFVYNDHQIDFEPKGKYDVMINATQMAKIFGKEVTRFLENSSTENFINACLNTRNSSFLNVKNREDLVRGKQKSGTWMHRVLALKFAAWLDPDFDVWIMITIDKILNEYYRQQKELKVRKVSLQSTIKQKKEAYLTKATADPEALEILKLEQEFKELDSVSKSESRKETRLIQLSLSLI